jgi:hypothetical protein
MSVAAKSPLSMYAKQIGKLVVERGSSASKRDNLGEEEEEEERGIINNAVSNTSDDRAHGNTDVAMSPISAAELMKTLNMLDQKSRETVLREEQSSGGNDNKQDVKNVVSVSHHDALCMHFLGSVAVLALGFPHSVPIFHTNLTIL